MPKLSNAVAFSVLFLCSSVCILHSQIEGGYWANSGSAGLGVNCKDEQLDSVAICATRVYCTDPPNPVTFFDITASANNRCSTQPVANSAFTSGAIGGMQETADGKAVAFLYNRPIEEEFITHDCLGATAILINFADPYGCDPPRHPFKEEAG